MKIFLKAKAWQLFILTFLLPVFIQFFLGRKMISSASPEMGPVPANLYNIIAFFSLSMVIAILTYIGWLWSVGTQLQKLIPQEHKIKNTWFKIALAIPSIYFVIVMVYFALSLKDGYLAPSFFNIMTPFHIISSVCLFYCMYFSARTYKTVRIQRHVTFEKCMGEFFMIWFFPFGIWIIQPKINQMEKEL